MLTICRFFLGVLMLATAAAPQARSERDRIQPIDLSTPRFIVNLVPHYADGDSVSAFQPHPQVSQSTLPLKVLRRNRLEFAIQQRDLFASGDRLQIRLASDAHVVAQLLSHGQLSGVEEESMVAILGLASRVRVNYDNGPWDLSLGATRRLGEGHFKARLSYTLRF
jgi:hypothetical protein